MKVTIRADASSRIGSGHIMRCLSLAEGLRLRGATVSFVCRNHPDHLAHLVEEQGFVMDLFPDGDPVRETGPLVDWRNFDWLTDAAETVNAVVSRYEKADWIVVDHYAIDARWEHATRRVTQRLLVVDDLADRPHDCDILLDQNVVTPVQKGYDVLLQPSTRRLFGLRYLLLRSEFSRPSSLRPVSARPKVLIFFGGTDPSHMTLRLLECVSTFGLDLRLCVLVGPRNHDRDQIRVLCQAGGHELHVDISNVAELIADCDIAVASCGFVAYELMALATPALLTAQTEIQWTVAKALQRLGVATALATEDLFDPEKLAAAVDRTLSISRRADGFSLISRDGVNNVISEMESLS